MDAKAQLFESLEQNGYVLVRSKTHLIYRQEESRRIFVVPKTPSDHRAYDNSLKQFQSLVRRGKVRGTFDIASSPREVAVEPAKEITAKSFKERQRGIAVDKFVRMHLHKVSVDTATMPTPRAAKPVELAGMYEVGSFLSFMFGTVTQVAMDRWDAQFEAMYGYPASKCVAYERQNRQLIAASNASARRCVKFVKLMRKGKRVKKQNVVNAVYRELEKREIPLKTAVALTNAYLYKWKAFTLLRSAVRIKKSYDPERRAIGYSIDYL